MQHQLMRVEPFAVVIRCTSAPDKADGKLAATSRGAAAGRGVKGRDESLKAFSRPGPD